MDSETFQQITEKIVSELHKSLSLNDTRRVIDLLRAKLLREQCTDLAVIADTIFADFRATEYGKDEGSICSLYKALKNDGGAVENPKTKRKRKLNPLIEKMRAMVVNVPIVVATKHERADAFNVAGRLGFKIQTRPCIGQPGFEIWKLE